jgi:hypothetical protein
VSKFYNCEFTAGHATNGVSGLRLGAGGQAEIYGCDMLAGLTNNHASIEHATSYLSVSGGNFNPAKVGGANAANVINLGAISIASTNGVTQPANLVLSNNNAYWLSAP